MVTRLILLFAKLSTTLQRIVFQVPKVSHGRWESHTAGPKLPADFATTFRQSNPLHTSYWRTRLVRLSQETELYDSWPRLWHSSEAAHMGTYKSIHAL